MIPIELGESFGGHGNLMIEGVRAWMRKQQQAFKIAYPALIHFNLGSSLAEIALTAPAADFS